MINKSIALLLLMFCSQWLMAQTTSKQIGVWGDQGNGTYKNPILNADYSDPDVIRMGNDFYMVCSDFHVYLRIAADLDANHTILQYSLNGKDFVQLGDECVLSKRNYWKGVRPGSFSYNTIGNGGTALFDWFHYRYDGPLGGM